MNFLTFEGGEGAGKSTQLRLLVDALGGMGIPVIATREPGGAPGAELLRSILLGEQSWSPLAETLLHFAARAEHVASTIRPALAAGTWVVCDRFTDSTMAYQSFGQGAKAADIAALSRLLGLEPTLTIVLDVAPAVMRARLLQRGGQADRYERLGPAFFARVNEGFRRIAAAAPKRCVLLAGDAAPEKIATEILDIVKKRFGLS